MELMSEHSRYTTTEGDVVKVYRDNNPDWPLEAMSNIKIFAINRQYSFLGGYNFKNMSALLTAMIETYVPKSYQKKLINKSKKFRLCW